MSLAKGDRNLRSPTSTRLSSLYSPDPNLRVQVVTCLTASFLSIVEQRPLPKCVLDVTARLICLARHSHACDHGPEHIALSFDYAINSTNGELTVTIPEGIKHGKVSCVGLCSIWRDQSRWFCSTALLLRCCGPGGVAAHADKSRQTQRFPLGAHGQQPHRCGDKMRVWTFHRLAVPSSFGW